jgi:hypothetical protein
LGQGYAILLLKLASNGNNSTTTMAREKKNTDLKSFATFESF